MHAGQMVPWFSRSGEALSEGERALIVESLGSPAMVVELVSGDNLARLLREEDADNRWWDAEEGERSRLWEIAAERFGESGLLAALDEAVNDLSATVRRSARRLADAGIADPGIVARAADAAVLSLHQL